MLQEKDVSDFHIFQGLVEPVVLVSRAGVAHLNHGCAVGLFVLLVARQIRETFLQNADEQNHSQDDCND